MSSPWGQRAPQADPLTAVAEYRLGAKRNCGMPGLFQACDAIGTPLVDVYLLKLQRAWLREPGSQGAVRRELALLASLRSEHLVLPRRIVKLEHQEYLVLEARRAVTFDRLISKMRRAGVRLPVGVIGRIFLDAALGLKALHAHLEQRPKATARAHAALGGTTIWVGEDGTTAVLDCGLARALPAQARRATSGLFGELGCKPPEALAGSVLGASSDTYSMAVLLCEALSGRRLFLRESLEETLSAISNSLPYEGWRREYGLTFDFVAKALSVKPSERYLTADAFADALQRQVTPASREETGEWVRYWVWERRSSWPVADIRSEGSNGCEDGDEEVTYRDADEPTQHMGEEHLMAPLSGGGVSSEMAVSLMRSVPPQLLRRLAEQDALERLERDNAAPLTARDNRVAWSSVRPEQTGPPQSPCASRLGQVLLGIAIGVLACAAWESYGAVLWSGTLFGLTSSPAAALGSRTPASGAWARGPKPSSRLGRAGPAVSAEQRPDEVPSPVATLGIPAPVRGGPGGALASSPSVGSHDNASHRGSHRMTDAPVEEAEMGDHGHDSPPSPALDEANELPPPAIVVPTRLHPRLNPLMTTQQVYPETR